MKNFVKLIQQVHEERFSVVVNEILAKKIPVAYLSLMPTDQAIENVKNFQAQSLNITNLIIVNDIPPHLVDLDFNIVHLSQAAQIYPQPEYIFTSYEMESRVAIKNFPASKVLTLRKDTEPIYETFMTHLDELQEVYNSLIDEESKRTFRGYWLAGVSNQLSKVVYSNTPHYICAGFIPESGAIVIEAGVFDGGTATIFSEMGYKVYGFEIDKINYERSLKVAEEKNFVVENLGLASYKHIAHYNLTGESGNKLIKDGTETVMVTTLDAYVREKNLPRVDYIKLDVEGAELDVLKGAAITIARYKPILALSAYHKWDDFWVLMNFVKSIRPDYEFAMRQSYMTPEGEPANFDQEIINYLINLGLEPDRRNYHECVLFAR